MFAGLWPDVPVDEVPIGSVTNGVHAPTWISPEIDDLLTRHVAARVGRRRRPRTGRAIGEVGDDELWRALQQGRERLVAFVREPPAGAHGWPRASRPATWPGRTSVLDPTVLTIGFARRFATYKRATLLLSQPERLQALLFDPDRPVQFVFAGKAHPADEPGKAMIQQIQQFAVQPERAPPLRVPRRLRHRRRPGAATRAPTSGSTRPAGRRRRAARAA